MEGGEGGGAGWRRGVGHREGEGPGAKGRAGGAGGAAHRRSAGRGVGGVGVDDLGEMVCGPAGWGRAGPSAPERRANVLGPPPAPRGSSGVGGGRRRRWRGSGGGVVEVREARGGRGPGRGGCGLGRGAAERRCRPAPAALMATSPASSSSSLSASASAPSPPASPAALGRREGGAPAAGRAVVGRSSRAQPRQLLEEPVLGSRRAARRAALASPGAPR